MFSLIITVISIALVAALAVASVYYGGPALSKGTSRAAAATVVSQGQQISGAATMYATDTAVDITAFSDLTDNDYLTSVPAVPASVGTGWSLDAANDLLEIVVADGKDISDICLEIEKNRDSSITAFDVTSQGGQFGCFMEDDVTVTTGVGTVDPLDHFEIYYSL